MIFHITNSFVCKRGLSECFKKNTALIKSKKKSTNRIADKSAVIKIPTLFAGG